MQEPNALKKHLVKQKIRILLNFEYELDQSLRKLPDYEENFKTCFKIFNEIDEQVSKEVKCLAELL